MGEPFTTDRKPTRRTKFLLMAAGSLTALAMTAVLPCLFLGIRSRQDLTAYRAMAEGSFPPVWKDLAWRRIRKGDELAETFEKHLPLRWEDFGPYTVLLYHRLGSANTLQIVAANGVLIRALLAVAAGSTTSSIVRRTSRHSTKPGPGTSSRRSWMARRGESTLRS